MSELNDGSDSSEYLHFLVSGVIAMMILAPWSAAHEQPGVSA